MAQEFSWQQPNAGVPIVQGWGPAPHLDAANIGPLVEGILRNRLGQQALGQKTVNDLAERIQAQKNEEDLAGYRAALAGEAGKHGTLYDAMAKWYGEDKPLAGGRGSGAGGGRSGGNTVDIYDDNGEYITSAPAGSVLARQYLAKTYPSLNPGLSSPQAVGQAKALGIPEADFFDSSRHYGYQTVPGGVDRQGNAVPLPLSPDQDPSEATHVGIKPSTSTDPNAAPVVIPRSIFTRIRQGLGAQDTSGAGAAAPQSAAPSSTVPGPAVSQTVTPQEPQKPVTRGEQIDPATAQQYLIKAQGNAAVARRMAQSDGWGF